MTTEHAYALIRGHTILGAFAIRAYEITDLITSQEPGIYHFTVIKPLFGGYFAMRKGRKLWTPKEYVVKTIEDLKDLTKELIIKSIFKHEKLYDLEELINQMNKV